MKRIFTLMLLAGASAAFAQTSVGLRGGVSSLANLNSSLNGAGKHQVCYTSLFARTQKLGSNWAFEALVGYDHYNSEGRGKPGYSGGGEGSSQNLYAFNQSHTELRVKAEYELSSACDGHSCCITSRFHNYIGLGLAYSRTHLNGWDGTVWVTIPDESMYHTQYNQFWGGFTNTLVLDVSRNVQVSGGFAWMIDLGNLPKDYRRTETNTFYQREGNSRLDFTLGIGYRF